MGKDKIYTAKELAEILKVSPKTIYKASKRGEIPTYRIGKSVRFAMPSMDKMKGENTWQVRGTQTKQQR